MTDVYRQGLVIKVVGVGGAGGNAVGRMVRCGLQDVEFLALNTDVQALGQMRGIHTFAIGPNTTQGQGSGGRPDIGRKAFKESQEQLAHLLLGSEMVFVTAGMGGGTGTGAAALVAEQARRQGALTVGVATLPFSFEGPGRRAIARQGLEQLGQKVDTLITIDNDRLLPGLKGTVSLEQAFMRADDVLMQGVRGIADIITVPGMINVDFADVQSVMSNGGPAFLAVGEGKGKWAAIEAVQMALSNPLFEAPIDGATGILLNVTGGKDLTLGQVHEVAGIVRRASKSDADVMLGVVQERRLGKRVSVTLVTTGLAGGPNKAESVPSEHGKRRAPGIAVSEALGGASTNGHAATAPVAGPRLL